MGLALLFFGIFILSIVGMIRKAIDESRVEKERKAKEKAQAEYESSAEYMMEIVEMAMRFKTGRTTKVPYPENEDDLNKLKIMYKAASKTFDVK